MFAKVCGVHTAEMFMLNWSGVGLHPLLGDGVGRVHSAMGESAVVATVVWLSAVLLSVCAKGVFVVGVSPVPSIPKSLIGPVRGIREPRGADRGGSPRCERDGPWSKVGWVRKAGQPSSFQRLNSVCRNLVFIKPQYHLKVFAN